MLNYQNEMQELNFMVGTIEMQNVLNSMKKINLEDVSQTSDDN